MIIVDVIDDDIHHDRVPIPCLSPSPPSRPVPRDPRAPRLHTQTVSVDRLAVQGNVRPDLAARRVDPERGPITPSRVRIVPTCISMI